MLNLLLICLKASAQKKFGTVEEVKSHALTVAECNIDDMSGEVWPYVQEKLMAAGALDAWITPIIMKKGRPAQMLSVLMHPQDLPVLEKIILTMTLHAIAAKEAL